MAINVMDCLFIPRLRMIVTNFLLDPKASHKEYSGDTRARKIKDHKEPSFT